MKQSDGFMVKQAEKSRMKSGGIKHDSFCKNNFLLREAISYLGNKS